LQIKKLDSHGNIFVAYTSNNRTQKFDPNGNFLLNIGKPGAPPGKAGFADGQFTQPRSIGIGPDDRLYVADTYNSRIQVFDDNGNFLMKFGNVGFGPGQFVFPAGVIVDNSTGNIFVADYGNFRIQVFNSHGSFLYQFPTRPAVMEPYFSYIDNKGHLFESDGASHYIIAFNTTTGSFISQFGGIGVNPGQFSGPRGIAIRFGRQLLGC
jgi:DNA-binding beta-propeller fold protein YncE